MDYRNLKILLLGILLGAMLLAGGMVFNALSNMFHNLQVKYTEQGVLLKL